MAGEDPGVGVITLILDLIRRSWDVVTSTAKTIFQTGLFVYFRKQMMRAQQGPKLKHGKQSLKHLRRHEDRGAQLVSVEIGDRQAMKALDHELKALKIDYSITKDDGEYTLHYKSINEKDVLLAQQHALEKRFGDPEVTQEDQKTPVEEVSEQNRQQETIDENARQQQEQERSSEPEQDQQEQQDPQQDERDQIDEPDEQQTGEQADELAPTNQLETPERQSGEQAPKTPRHAKQQTEPYADLANAPLSDVIAVARERAHKKNLARSQNRGLGHDHNRSRSRDHFIDK